MKKVILCMLLLLALSACEKKLFVAGDLSKERKELYEYNNNEQYCKENPNDCVNNIPWH